MKFNRIRTVVAVPLLSILCASCGSGGAVDSEVGNTIETSTVSGLPEAAAALPGEDLNMANTSDADVVVPNAGASGSVYYALLTGSNSEPVAGSEALSAAAPEVGDADPVGNPFAAVEAESDVQPEIESTAEPVDVAVVDEISREPEAVATTEAPQPELAEATTPDPVNIGEQPADPNKNCAVDSSVQQDSSLTHPDEYLADFLYKNSDVCMWEVDLASMCVTPIPIPTPPGNAVILPASNGSNDTAAIQQMIAAGGDFVGNGSTYRLNNLQITAPTRIWNMPSNPAAGAQIIGEIRSADVQIFNSLIDGLNQPGFRAGWEVEDGSHRFTLIKSGVINVNDVGAVHTYGVMAAEADDIHIACNRFENLFSKQAAARALWMNPGSSGSRITRGGVFANNYGGNFQSKNNGNDAEVVTLQGHIGKQIQDRPFLVMANRFVDAGKRLVKLQTGNTKTLSNFYHWKNASGPLGGRAMEEAVSTFTSNNIARNNHFKYSAQGGVAKTFFMLLGGSLEAVPDNNHFNYNLIEYDVDTPTTSTSSVLVGTTHKSEALSGTEFTNSSFTNNTILGPGKPLYGYWFRGGWDDNGNNFIHNPNTWKTTGQWGQYKP